MTTYASSDFEGTEGTTLSTYDSAFQKVTGFTGSMEIASGRIRPSSTTSSRYYHTTAPGSADYSVSGDVYSAGTGGNKQVQLYGRCQSGANTGYRLGIYVKSSTQCTVQLYKFVSGTATQLGSTTDVTHEEGFTYNLKLEMIGSAIKAYHNGTQIISVTDSAITAAGYSGVGSYADSTPSDSVGAHLASYSVDSTGAATQTLTPSLFTNTNTFYAPTVLQPGSLFPSLFTNTNTFYAPTVSRTTVGTQITSTELGATGRYVYFDQAAFDDLGSQTILCYCRPTGSGGGGFAYMYGKTPTGSINGPRFFIDHNSGSPLPTFGSSSSTKAGFPTRPGTANSAVYNSWGHYAVTWDGSLDSTNLIVYAGVGTDLADVSASDTSTNDGTGSVSSDAANPAFLMNRYGLGREFIGDVAYIAVWDSVLTLTQLQNAQNNGPLEEPTGLVLLWANQADLSSSAFTETGRSTYAAGSLPPNTTLGGSVTLLPSLFTNTNTFYSPTVSNAAGTQDIAPSLLTNTNSFFAATVANVMVVSDSYERSSINVSGSSVTGSGDSAVIVLKPRVQESEVVSSQTRWLEPSAQVDGVDGFRPTFRFSDYAATETTGTYHGAPWQSTRYPMFSYDRETWHYFDTKTVNTTYVEFRHNTAFTADAVYITRGRQVSVTQEGTWLAALAAAYPAIVVPTTTAAAFTPTLTSWPAQTFIADEFSAQTDELSRTIPACPLYAYEINDTSLMPAGGVKRLAVISSGVHAGEDQGNFAMREFVTALLGSSTEAQALRRQYRVLVYPVVNAPGRVGGGWRGSFTNGTAGADDANRHFSDASPGLEIVTKPRTAMVADMGGLVPDWEIDFHGDYGNQWALFVDNALQTTFRTRLATNSGFTVTDGGATTSSGFVSRYFQDTVGSTLTVTLEHGDPVSVSDANLVTWGAAIVTTLDSMRSDGLLFTTQDLTPSLFSNSNTFYAPAVTAEGGPQYLTPALVSNTSTFYTPAVTTGAVTLTPGLYTNSNTFYAPVVTVEGGPQYLTPALASNTSTFYSATVSTGAITITPALFANSQTFYTPTVSQGFAGQELSPPLVASTNQFFTTVVTTGGVTVTPGLFVNSSTFYQHLLSGGEVLYSGADTIFIAASERRIFRD